MPKQLPEIYEAAARDLCLLEPDHPVYERSLELLERLCAGMRQLQKAMKSRQSTEAQKQL